MGVQDVKTVLQLFLHVCQRLPASFVHFDCTVRMESTSFREMCLRFWAAFWAFTGVSSWLKPMMWTSTALRMLVPTGVQVVVWLCSLFLRPFACSNLMLAWHYLDLGMVFR